MVNKKPPIILDKRLRLKNMMSKKSHFQLCKKTGHSLIKAGGIPGGQLKTGIIIFCGQEE